MRGKGIIPAKEHCVFFHPNLIRKNNVQPDTARGATLEMITGPWIILSFTNPRTNKAGYVIFYRRRGESSPEFLYIIDYLMYYQLLDANTEVYLRMLDPALNAPAMFDKAVQEYVQECENSAEIEKLLRAISYSSISNIHTKFSVIEIGMDNV